MFKRKKKAREILIFDYFLRISVSELMLEKGLFDFTFFCEESLFLFYFIFRQKRFLKNFNIYLKKNGKRNVFEFIKKNLNTITEGDRALFSLFARFIIASKEHRTKYTVNYK